MSSVSARFLDRPYPVKEPDQSYWTPPLTGLFVYLFLAFFEPFGIDEIPASWIKQGYLLGYGLITGGIMFISTLVLPGIKAFNSYFDESRWTLGRHLAFSSLNILCIAVANFIYSIAVFGFELSWESLIFFLIATGALGIFPVTMMVLVKHNHLLRKNLEEAKQLQADLKIHEQHQELSQIHQEALKLMDENGQLLIAIDPEQLLCVIADDNYLDLYLTEGQKTKKHTLRYTLSKLEQNCSTWPNLVRCHRKYLINLNQLEEVSGNAQGLRLRLKNLSSEVPVSRAMVPLIRQRLQA
jgi:hypothetical protein